MADTPTASDYSAKRHSSTATQPMAELLVRHAAADVPLQGNVAFQVACRQLDRSEARRLASLHPECLRDPEVMLTAAREGRLDIVSLLLDRTLHVDIVDESEMRALNIAAGSGAVDIVKLLIERGADIDRPTKHYGGPLGFAGHFGQRATGGGARLAQPRRAQPGFLGHEGSAARAFRRRA